MRHDQALALTDSSALPQVREAVAGVSLGMNDAMGTNKINTEACHPHLPPTVSETYAGQTLHSKMGFPSQMGTSNEQPIPEPQAFEEVLILSALPQSNPIPHRNPGNPTV